MILSTLLKCRSVKPWHRWKVPQHAEPPVEPTNWNVPQRPLSLVSFISRLPAGNGSLWEVAIGAPPALPGEAGYGMIPKKPVLDLIRDG